MNSYYAEFHAREKVDRWQREADQERRVDQAQPPKRAAGRILFFVWAAAALRGLMQALTAAAGGEARDGNEAPTAVTFHHPMGASNEQEGAVSSGSA